jgi:hypothetical protein
MGEMSRYRTHVESALARQNGAFQGESRLHVTSQFIETTQISDNRIYQALRPILGNAILLFPLRLPGNPMDHQVVGAGDF